MGKNDTCKNISLLGSTKGLTLLELIIVIAILGVLAAIVIPNVASYREKVAYVKTFNEIRLIEKEIISFNLANGRFPKDLAEVGLDGMTDYWGTPYQYLNITTAGPKDIKNIRKDHSLVPVNSDFDLYSMGPDGKTRSPFTAMESRDDIVRANNGSFVGRVSNY